jgi:NAD(P)-dependent dehydrogenase (short-subunit alcohol dehydrogenase family)
MSNLCREERNILITGGTSGLGLELARKFIDNGSSVVMTGRHPARIPEREDKIRILIVDFSDLRQVKERISTLLKSSGQIDAVINNAGILSPPGRTTTVNGFEYTYQVNFLSHLLVNELILRNIKNDRKITVAAITSPAFRLADPEIMRNPSEQKYSPIMAYATSKLFLTMMCEHLPLRFRELNLKCFCFNPGTFRSGIYRMQKEWFRSAYRVAAPFMRDPSKVADILTEIMSDEQFRNGVIYDYRKSVRSIPSVDEKLKRDFWNRCYGQIQPFIEV